MNNCQSCLKEKATHICKACNIKMCDNCASRHKLLWGEGTPVRILDEGVKK